MKKITPMVLDQIDMDLLNLLQEDGRMALKDLAAKVYMSSPAVAARIELLKKAGYIHGYRGILNYRLLGYHIKAFINLELEPVQKKEFYPFIKSEKNVVECNCVTGEYAMLIQVLFPSTEELDGFINRLQKFGKTKTQIVFSTSVEHRGIQIIES